MLPTIRFGAGEPGHLVVRVVPRHDPEQRADRSLADESPTVGVGLECLVGQQLRSLVGVVPVDVDRVLDLVDRFGLWSCPSRG